MAATESSTDAPGLAHPTVVPTNARKESRCPECGAPADEESERD